MRLTTFILFLLFSQNILGQVKFGTYSQIDTSLYADLKLYPDNKFEFHDTRNQSCWLWGNYNGEWKIIKDTIVFSWSYDWTEDADSVVKNNDPKSNNITLIFLYNDGQPIENAEACYACDFYVECKNYYSDKAGKIVIPRSEILDSKKKGCTNDERRLYYSIKNKYIEFSSSGVQDTVTNKFTIIIKKELVSKIITEKKKYLVSGNNLIDIDSRKNSLLNWGKFIFLTTSFDR